MQEEDVQIGHAWVKTIGRHAISVAYCLPPCPELCIHSEDRQLYSSFPSLHILVVRPQSASKDQTAAHSLPLSPAVGWGEE